MGQSPLGKQPAAVWRVAWGFLGGEPLAIPADGVPPGTLNIVGLGVQRSPIVVRLRRTPMFGSRRTDVLEFLSGHGGQKSLHCRDAEKKTAVTKASLPG